MDGELWNTPEKKSSRGSATRSKDLQGTTAEASIHLEARWQTKASARYSRMLDRAHQALHLLALDPVAETVADPNSYGFRRERSTADAIEQLFITLQSERFRSMDTGGGYPSLL